MGRGKEDLAEELINDNLLRRAYRGGPISFAADVARGLGGLKSLWKQFRHPYDTEDPYKQVEKVFQTIDDEDFAGMLKAKADIIRKHHGIKPNLQTELFTGDSETDIGMLQMIKGFAGGYGTKKGGRINTSGDFDEFRKALADADAPNKISLVAQPTIGPEGNVVVEVVANGKDGRIGGMVVQPDEAYRMGIDVNTLYETKEVSALRNKITYNGGKSSAGDPGEISTYIQGDAYYDIDDFNQLKNSKINAKGNVVKVGNTYYPYLYVTDGKVENVRQLPGSPNLGAAVGALLDVNPTYATMVLNEKSNR